MQDTVLFLFLLLVMSAAQVRAGTCFMQSDGTMPPAGACTGPVGRESVIRNNIRIINYNCSLSQVPYYPDGNSSAPVQCGECVPGTAGADDSRQLCGVNDYCTDDARCLHAGFSPFFGQPCPYDGGSMCGPGLSCIEHVCIICEEGVYDPTDGKVCFNGQWTYSEWDTLSTNPEAVFLLVIMILFIISIIRPLFVRKGAWKKGYLLKWLRKNKKAKMLWRWSEEQAERGLNKALRRTQKEDMSTRRRRRESVPLPYVREPHGPTESEAGDSSLTEDTKGTQSEDEGTEMEDIATLAEGGEEDASKANTSRLEENGKRARADSLVEEVGPDEVPERKPRRGSSVRGPGKFIPTLERPRQFGFYTTKGEWVEKMEGQQI